MTAERYTPEELPYRLYIWKQCVLTYRDGGNIRMPVGLDEFDRLLATVEAMAGDAERLKAALNECEKYSGTTWD